MSRSEVELPAGASDADAVAGLLPLLAGGPMTASNVGFSAPSWFSEGTNSSSLSLHSFSSDTRVGDCLVRGSAVFFGAILL